MVADHRIILPNIRQNYNVLYLLNTKSIAPVPSFTAINGTIAGSNTVININPYEPTGVHLTLTPSPR
jgi:hypothetical protein